MSVLLEFVQAGNDDLEILREILESRADPNETADDGRTALHLLASKTSRNRQDADNVLEMARILITSGADVNASNGVEWTPLMEAVRADNLRMVELFLERNANVNQPDNEGNTPLHHAVDTSNSVNLGRNDVKYIRRHIVKTLVSNGCDLNLLNNTHKAPLMLAVENQEYLIVRELLRQRASVNTRDNLNNSLMHYALDQEEVNEDIVLELVRHGCLFCDKNQDNETALDVYIRKLESASDDKLKAAKYVFKLLVFQGYELEDEEKRILYNVGEAEKGKLPDYCQSCRTEWRVMLRCNIGQRYVMYDIVEFVLSCRNVDALNIPDVVFDKVLKKLFKGEFPCYCDIIVSGISRTYLLKEFSIRVKDVADVSTGFMSIDVLQWLTPYLSNIEMFNIMVACSVKKSCCSCLLDTCRKCFICN